VKARRHVVVQNVVRREPVGRLY